MRARQYVPRWGRFTSRDPIGLGGGASLYSFTGSRPIATGDPSGLLPVRRSGWHGPKSCSYWGGFNATGGIGDYPFLPAPDEWNPDNGSDPGAVLRGPTGDAVKDGTGMMAGPGAPNVPKGVSRDGNVCKGADGSIAGSLVDGQFLPMQTIRISEVIVPFNGSGTTATPDLERFRCRQRDRWTPHRSSNSSAWASLRYSEARK